MDKPIALIVDDYADFREVLRLHLVACGLEVVEAANTREAVALVEGGVRPDVVVTDLVMPAPDGARLVRWLRELPDLAGVPIVMLTAAPSDDPRLTPVARLSGVEIVTKPPDWRRLPAHLRALALGAGSRQPAGRAV